MDGGAVGVRVALRELADAEARATEALNRRLKEAWPAGTRVMFRWQEYQKHPTPGRVIGHHDGQVRIQHVGSEAVRQVGFERIETEPKS